MATWQEAATTDLGHTDEETAEENGPVIANPVPARVAPARRSWRLAAGAVGALVVVAVVAAALRSPSEDEAPECEGESCRAQSGHLDKVLMMKQNTMQPGDCPAGYTGTSLNIKGAGKAWSFGNLSDCANTCDNREGCKGFEFHDKNGRCGTYLDGYVLGGKQFYRWLTCIKEDEGASVEFTIGGLNYDDLVTDQEAKEALERAVAETIGGSLGVDPGRVSVTLSAGSLKVQARVIASARDQALNFQTSLTQNGSVLDRSIAESLKAIPEVMAKVNGDLAVSKPIVEMFGEGTKMATTTTSKTVNTMRALTLAGGGFLSYSDFAGLAAGLLAFTSSQDAPYATNFSELFSSFGTVAGISGGAWFQSQFVYSKTYEDMLNELVRLAKQGKFREAARVFNGQVGQKLFPGDFSKIDQKAIECMMATAELVDPSLKGAVRNASVLMRGALSGGDQHASEAQILQGVLQMLQAQAAQFGIPELHLTIAKELMVVLSKNDGYVTWDMINAIFFERVADLKSDVALGSTTINKWAEDKVMIWGTTLPAPSAGTPGYAYLNMQTQPPTELTYNTVVTGGDAIESDDLVVPGRFSYVTSSSNHERNQSSSMPFCAQSDCFGSENKYSGSPDGSSEMAKPLGDQFQTAFESVAASLPVSSVAAASSSFKWRLGFWDMFDAASHCLDLAVWADGTPLSSFSSATALRKSLVGAVTADNLDENVKKLADAGLLALGDGGDTDFTGIAAAVAAGATAVTAWLYVDVTDTAEDEVYKKYWALTSHFKKPNVRQIFAQPSVDDANAAIKAFARIPPPEDAKFLNGIAYGTIECTTIDNKLQGIKEGQRVRVNVIAVETHDLTIGMVEMGYAFSSFDDYGIVVSEILDVLTAPGNSEEVQAIIDSFFKAGGP